MVEFLGKSGDAPMEHGAPAPPVAMYVAQVLSATHMPSAPGIAAVQLRPAPQEQSTETLQPASRPVPHWPMRPGEVQVAAVHGGVQRPFTQVSGRMQVPQLSVGPPQALVYE